MERSASSCIDLRPAARAHALDLPTVLLRPPRIVVQAAWAGGAAIQPWTLRWWGLGGAGPGRRGAIRCISFVRQSCIMTPAGTCVVPQPPAFFPSASDRHGVASESRASAGEAPSPDELVHDQRVVVTTATVRPFPSPFPSVPFLALCALLL